MSGNHFQTPFCNCLQKKLALSGRREAMSDGINEVEVPPHQFGEGSFGLIPSEFPNQVHVQRIGHLLIISANGKSGQTIFSFLGGRGSFRREGLRRVYR
jgi:hypothetical protein